MGATLTSSGCKKKISSFFTKKNTGNLQHKSINRVGVDKRAFSNSRYKLGVVDII